MVVSMVPVKHINRDSEAKKIVRFIQQQMDCVDSDLVWTTVRNLLARLDEGEDRAASDGPQGNLALEAYAAWCEARAAIVDGHNASKARAAAYRALEDAHCAYAAAHGYATFDRRRADSPELAAARAAVREADEAVSQAWNYVSETEDWLSDMMAIWHSWMDWE